MSDYSTFLQAVRQASPYINSHRDKTFVVLLDGYCLQSEHLKSVIFDIALLHSLGIKIVLVLGTRPLINEALSQASINTQIHQGRRVTDSQTLSIAKSVSGQLRFDIEALFSSTLPNTPMHGSDIQIVSGNFITAKPLGIIDGVDYQFSGSVRKIDTAAIQEQLKHDSITLLTNIAYSPTGECFNVPAEEVASICAQSLQADKFIVVSDDKALAGLARELTVTQAKQVSDSPSLLSLVKACELGIERCHLVNANIDGSLLIELFSTDGSGTLVTQEPFEVIRQAQVHDIGGIMAILSPLEAAGILVKRERDLLEAEIEHFIVIERDKQIIACSALYPYHDAKENTQLSHAEIACVATNKAYQGAKRGAKMLAFLEAKAKQMNIKTLFVLTTQTAHFFQEQGFEAADLNQLPQNKQALYNFQRNSKVFIKTL